MVEMHELQARLHFRRAQFFDGEQDFGGVQAELGIVAGRERPFSFAARLQLHPEADHRLHAGFLGNFDDAVDLGELLDDDNDLFAQFAPEQGQPHVIVVLVPVADDQALRAFVHGEGDHQLGF